MRRLASLMACLMPGLTLAWTVPAAAQDQPQGQSLPEAADRPTRAIEIAFVYTADTGIVAAGGARHRPFYLDNSDLIMEVDMDRLVGWRGALVHLYGLGNFGTYPSNQLDTLEGINNIEVPQTGARLFEAWIDQSIGERGSVRAGLYHLNSEFYATPSSDLLIAPPFGIGSEFAASGNNGPSIFPSSALTVRARMTLGKSGYGQVAAVDADARTFGDAGGVDTGLGDGVVMVAQAGGGNRLRLGLGGWIYTRLRPDIVRLDADGEPLKRRAMGVYMLGEWQLGADDATRLPTLFLRGGVSDGRTTPFMGSAQAGVLVERLFASRPDSAASFGIRRGWTSPAYRALLRRDGSVPAVAETALELTYSDRVLPHVTLQPDAQIVFQPGGLRDSPTALVLQLRTTFDF